jgi:hypothetical protein
MAVTHYVCVDIALRHSILWMNFYTHCTKMEAPKYVCTDVFQRGTVLLKIPYSHLTKLGDVHCGFSDTPSDSVAAWVNFYTSHK